jgi:uncharacterized repeat protein (TIGR02543 family)
VESAHPHKVYYECTICGDKFFTGYDEAMSGCKRCFSCGCKEEFAGYYILDSRGWGRINLRSVHSMDGDIIGCVIEGAVVYVHGASAANGWAYVEYDGLRGHVMMQYLKKYVPAPEAPVLSEILPEYLRGDTVTLQWSAPEHAEDYRIRCYRDGALQQETMADESRSFTLMDAQPGSYRVEVCAANKTGWSPAAVSSFRVLQQYTVTYDASGGTGAPAAAMVTEGRTLTLDPAIPVRSGYVFAGWSDDSGAWLAQYKPGSSFSPLGDTTLYAVWRSETAVPAELTVEQLPRRTVYRVGESLDTGGLILRLRYSDGTAELVNEGYTTEDFCAGEMGSYTVKVTCQGLDTAFTVEVVSCLPGDVNLDDRVDRDDVMTLLWHITFPDQFSISAPGDFTGDGKINRDDVMLLLWHITFPELFPLDI